MLNYPIFIHNNLSYKKNLLLSIQTIFKIINKYNNDNSTGLRIIRNLNIY